VGQSDRLIDVEWDTDIAATFVASIEVKGLDRARLLRDVSAVLADHHVNIVSCNTLTGSDRISKMRFDFELGDPSHLDSVIAGIKQIDGIYDAYRVLPGKGEVSVDKPARSAVDDDDDFDQAPLAGGPADGESAPISL
jgi:GTP pyrophosphokinase